MQDDPTIKEEHTNMKSRFHIGLFYYEGEVMPRSEFQNTPDLVNPLKKEIQSGNVQGAKEIIRMLGEISASDMRDLFDLTDQRDDFEIMGWMYEFLIRSKKAYSEEAYIGLWKYGKELYIDLLHSEITSAIAGGHLDKYKDLYGIISSDDHINNSEFYYSLHTFVIDRPIIEAGNNGHFEMLEYFYSKKYESECIDMEDFFHAKRIDIILLDKLCFPPSNVKSGFVETYFKLPVGGKHGRYEIDQRHFKDKRTIIMIAAGCGRSDLVKVLVDIGADRSLFDDNGNTLLSYALSSGDRETIKYVFSLYDEEAIFDELLRHGEDHYPLSTVPFEKWMI